MLRPLIQVVPTGNGGVLDYAMCLKAQWAQGGLDTHLLAMSKALARERSLADRVSDCMVAGPVASLPHCSVVLHFSGYGYSPRGLCFWLLDELEVLRERFGAALRLVVVFHELFATGPPWKSAFWVSRLQAVIAERLAHRADELWTNAERHARWLRKVPTLAAQVHAYPVFSNVGEPGAVPSFTERRAQAVVFGSAATRQHAFDGLRSAEPALRQLGIQELVEVGSGPPSRRSLQSIACRFAGRLEPDELGQVLRDSRYGLLHYPTNSLGKSGVFAAYAAHGCVVVNTSLPANCGEGLAVGQDYLTLSDLASLDLGAAAQEERAARLASWYAGHKLTRQAPELLRLATA